MAAAAWSQPLAKSADDSAPLGIALTVKRVSVDAQGKETLADAPETKPGDLLEYSAVYTNRGTKLIKDLVATLPIPQNTVYQPSSAKPRGALASLGADYGAEPLQRKVRGPDGKEKTEPVPYSEYRSLRWRIAALEAGRAVTVAARVKLPGTTEQPPAKP